MPDYKTLVRTLDFPPYEKIITAADIDAAKDIVDSMFISGDVLIGDNEYLKVNGNAISAVHIYE
jgi:hypothetical protein